MVATVYKNFTIARSVRSYRQSVILAYGYLYNYKTLRRNVIPKLYWRNSDQSETITINKEKKKSYRLKNYGLKEVFTDYNSIIISSSSSLLVYCPPNHN